MQDLVIKCQTPYYEANPIVRLMHSFLSIFAEAYLDIQVYSSKENASVVVNGKLVSKIINIVLDYITL